VAHSSLQGGGWLIELSNTLCTMVAPADPFPLSATSSQDEAFGLLALALLYGFMGLFLGLFMFARVVLIAVLLIVAPLARWCGRHDYRANCGWTSSSATFSFSSSRC
jgi:hypothetical protein